MALQTPGIASRTLRGMFWAYGSYFVGRALVLVSIAILARLLTPSQFGLVAFALTVTAVLDTIADLGVSQALILVKQDKLGSKPDTAWTLGVMLGTALTAITAALGPAAAAFFNQPELELMLPILGANFLLRSLGVTHLALAQKQLDFRTRTLAEMSDVVLRGFVGIGLALVGAGAYSLVGGYLAGSLATTATLWLLVPFRPSLRLHRGDLGGLLRFGGGLTTLNMISAVISQADYIIIGKVLGATSLGLYTLGFRLPELIIINLSYVAGLVLFPAFAQIGRPQLAEAYLTSLRYVLIVCVPVAVALALLAEPIVLIAFGDQWVESIAVMQVLTLLALATTVGVPAGTAYKSIGRIDVLVKLAIPRALLGVAVILVFVDHGIVAVAICQTSVATMFSLIHIVLAGRLLSTGLRRIWIAAWPPLLAGAVMGGVVEGVVLVVEGPYATLGAAAPVGGAVYVATLWVVAPSAMRKLWRTASSAKAQPEPGPQPPPA